VFAPNNIFHVGIHVDNFLLHFLLFIA